MWKSLEFVFLPALKYTRMKKAILLCLLLGYAKVSSGNSLEEFFKKADQLLQTYVDNGKVDYKKMRMEQTGIRELYKDIGKISLEGKSREEIKAFYLNAYNIIVIHETLFNKKRRKLFRNCKFFKEIRHTVSGEDLTLEGIQMSIFSWDTALWEKVSSRNLRYFPKILTSNWNT